MPSALASWKKIFQFSTKPSEPSSSYGSRKRSARKTEHWDEPVAGLYEYLPGRGWYLIKRDGADSEGKTRREPVVRSSILHRWILQSDLDERWRVAKVPDENGQLADKRFFRLDDGITYISCWGEDGSFTPGPWQRWVVDERTGVLRKMLVGDDPERRSRKASSRGTSTPKTISRPASVVDEHS